mmetsp:Transcript_12102/g.16167  ORF Transcript_12102/g.16167 Transcript_12102/m.16167 type:complete len:98 (+) Transcript_12102:649-942(+)
MSCPLPKHGPQDSLKSTANLDSAGFIRILVGLILLKPFSVNRNAFGEDFHPPMPDQEKLQYPPKISPVVEKMTVRVGPWVSHFVWKSDTPHPSLDAR